MVSSSSSFKKSHKPTMSFNSLPDDLLVEISSCVGASSFFFIHNLQLVSKPFQRYCNEPYVLHRLSLHELPFFSWYDHNEENHCNFFKKCRKSGNPEALYRKGLIDFFYQKSPQQERKGIKRLTIAAGKGNQEAQYAYGMILICHGDKTKHKGFKILSSLLKPLMSSTMKELKKLRENIRDHIWWRGRPVMQRLKRSYVRENCNCNGQTETFLAKSCVWNGYGEDKDMISSYACQNCLWDSEVKLFFDNLEIID